VGPEPDGGGVDRVNVAVTVVFPVIVVAHDPVPLHPPPDQPLNVEPELAVAVRVILVPEVILDWVQVEPQLMEPPVIVPLPVPVFETVSV